MNPQIITRPAFVVIGVKYQGRNENNEIPQLWDAFLPDRAAEITGKVNPNVAYGVEDHYDAETGEFDYVAGFEVSADTPTPDGMVRWQIPAQTYAVFKGSLPRIKEMYAHAYRQWLPQSNYRRHSGPEFEFYDEDFTPCKDKLDMYLYIPIIRK